MKREVLTVGYRGNGKLKRAEQKTQELITMERAIEMAIEPLKSMLPGSILGAIGAEMTTKMQDLFRGKDYFYPPHIIPGRRVLDVIRASVGKNAHDIEFRRKNAYLVRAIKRARRESDTKNSTVAFLIPAIPDPIRPGLDFFIGRSRLDYNLAHPTRRKIILYRQDGFILESI